MDGRKPFGGIYCMRECKLLFVVASLIMSGCAAPAVHRLPAPSTMSAQLDIAEDSDESATTEPADPAVRQRRYFERATREIEPSLKGEATRLPQYVQFFSRKFVTDPRVFAFSVQAEQARKGGPVVLRGYAEF